MTTRIAILASGSGTIAQALLDASALDDLSGAEVVLVVSDRSGAQVLERAERAGVESLFLGSKGFPDRVGYSEALAAELQKRNIELVCLSGFMKILSPPFVRAFEGRILNTHAALLPAFPGAHPVRDTLTWGVKVTGATIHFVDEDVDHGPIVIQEAVPILPGDDESSLHERIKEVERRIYPEAVRLVVEGRTRIEGRTVRILEGRSVDTPLEGRSVDTPKGFDRRAKLAVDRPSGFDRRAGARRGSASFPDGARA